MCVCCRPGSSYLLLCSDLPLRGLEFMSMRALCLPSPSHPEEKAPEDCLPWKDSEGHQEPSTAMLSADPAVAAQVARSAPARTALAQAISVSAEGPDLSLGPSPRASDLTMTLMVREDPPTSVFCRTLGAAGGTSSLHIHATGGHLSVPAPLTRPQRARA